MRTGKGRENGPILRPLSGRAGFTYMGMLVIIMIIGITSAVVGQSWRIFAKGEKEKELALARASVPPGDKTILSLSPD